MGGEISVSSELGKGSVFSFTLSFDCTFKETSLYKAEGEETRLSLKNKIKGSILVVEDNRSNALYLQMILQARGLSVEVATSGERALEVLEKQAFHLIFMDLHMPGIGGAETLKRIRQLKGDESQSSVPIVVLSADVSDEAREKSVLCGANEFVSKPVAPETINTLLVKYL